MLAAARRSSGICRWGASATREQRRRRSCGLVGLPNVGKSTLYNALAGRQLAEASNFPFCTIEPSKTKVAVPDPRLDSLAATVGSSRTIPAQVEIVDIAGLIKGASDGAGLGNQFLGNIRGVDVVLQVVRCFDNEGVPARPYIVALRQLCKLSRGNDFL